MATKWHGLVEALAEGQGLFVSAEGEPQLQVGWQSQALLPGSFNPVHAGHWGLAQAAARFLGAPVAFELSLTNVDKPPLTGEETGLRLAQFRGRAAVWLTRAPRFTDKAKLFPGATIIVGADTAQRILDLRYYHGREGLHEALAEMRRQQCRFLVAGRAEHSGRLLRLGDLPAPAAFADLFQELPIDNFRLDLSSTQLREYDCGTSL